MDISIRERVSEDRPIFMTRLVEDSGWSITGGAAQVGRVGMTVAIRSDTNCRAVSRSVPGLNSITMADSCDTDFDRIWSRPSMPLKACSIGTVTSSSTSEAVRPRHAVWTSTRGGANSGKTSTEALLSCAPPTIMRAAAIAMMIDRNLRLAATIRRMSVRRIEFSAEEFSRADGHDCGAHRGAGRGRDHSVLHLGYRDRLPLVDPRGRVGVHPGFSAGVVEQGGVGHDDVLTLS